MAGKPEAVSLESEIVSKKGKIPNREVNETHLKVTRPKSSKVTEKPKAERKQKGRPDEQNTASACSSEKADCMNGAKIVSEPTSATGDSPKSSLQDTVVATMQAGFDHLTNILIAEKAQTSRKRPAVSDSDDMSDSEEIKSSKAKCSRVSSDTLSDSGPVIDVEGDINSLIQQSTCPPEPSLCEENEILGAIVQEYDLEEKCGPPVNEKLAAIVNKMARSKLADDKLKEKLTQYTRPKNCEKLVGTKVNPEIWAKISPATRSRDLKLQKIQTTLLKATTVLVEVTDKFVESKDQSKSLLNEATKSLFDAIALVTHANCDLNHRRRDLIKPDLNRSYQQICSEQIAVTETFLGMSFPHKKKGIITTNKVGNKLTDPNGKHTRPNRSSGQDFRRPYFSKNGQRSGWRFQTHQQKWQSSPRNIPYPPKKKEEGRAQK